MAEPWLRVTLEDKGLKAVLDALSRPGADPAIAKALRDTANSCKVQATKVIGQRTGLAAKVIRSRIRVRSVRSGDMYVLIYSDAKSLRLIEFPGTKQTNTGVVTKAWGRSQVIRSAFISTMPAGTRGASSRPGRGALPKSGANQGSPNKSAGHKGAYVRTTRARLPIQELFGPHIHGTFVTREVANVLTETTNTRFGNNLRRRLREQIMRAEGRL